MLTNKFINQLKDYFEKKENRTDEENLMLETLKVYSDAFPITAVSREDLILKGFATADIDDSDMTELAERLSDDYVSQLFWDSLEVIADIMGFPRLEDFEED